MTEPQRCQQCGKSTPLLWAGRYCRLCWDFGAQLRRASAQAAKQRRKR